MTKDDVQAARELSEAILRMLRRRRLTRLVCASALYEALCQVLLEETGSKKEVARYLIDVAHGILQKEGSESDTKH